MKTKMNPLRSFALAIAGLTLLGAAPVNHAADPHMSMKGAEHLVYLNSPAKAEELKKGDTVAMVCAKCKSVSVTRVEKQRGHWYTKSGTKHGCAGCGSEIEVVRMGDHGIDKQKHETVKHVCKTCGGESAFCCATKAGTADKGAHKH